MALLTHDRWASLVSGRYVDIDGSYGGQCWDTFADYCISVLGVPPINTWGGKWSGWAYAIWDQYWNNGASKYFDLVQPHEPARKGDIPIWRLHYPHYPSTHIAVAEADAGQFVYCMSQNSSPAQPWLPGYSTSATGPNVRQYLTKQGLAGYLRRKSHIVVAAPVNIKPKEWDEMASKEDFKAAIREVLSEPGTLDRIALAILKRDCYLVDPSGESGKIVGTTNLAKKINWMAHNDAQLLKAVALANQGVEGIADLLQKHTLEVPSGIPLEAAEAGIVQSEDGLQPGVEFVCPSADVEEEAK